MYLDTCLINDTVFLIVIISYGVKVTWYSVSNILPLVSSDFCTSLYNNVFITAVG